MGSIEQPITGKARALRERAGLTMENMAREMGYKGASSWQRYETPGGFTKPFLPREIVHRMASVLVGRGDPPITAAEVYALGGFRVDAGAEVVEVTAHDDVSSFSSARVKPIREKRIQLPGGGGSFVGEGEDHAVWQLPADYVDKLTRNSNNLLIIEMVGDSMSPTLLPGDRIMLDTGDTDPAIPGIFAVYDGNVTVVKRVEKVPMSDPPQLALISDNDFHGRYTVPAELARIAGRVVWKACRVS